MSQFYDTLALIDKVSQPLAKINQKAKENAKRLDETKEAIEKANKANKRLQNTYQGLGGFLRKFNDKLGVLNARIARVSARFANLSRLGQGIQSFGNSLTVGLTLPIMAAGAASIKFASDLDETLNKVDVSFGNSSEKVKEWAKTSITSMGLAKQSALDSAALFGDMATGMGLSQEKAADMAMTLTQLGADLASFKNISNDVATTALKSIFTGETESLKNLGVVMTQTNLEQFAYSQGIRKKIKDMTEAEKINLRYNYVLSQTKNAQGDFVRTGGGAANQMRMFQEQMKELGALFGELILPAFTKFITKINGLLKAFSNLSPNTRKIIVVLSGLLAIIGPLIAIVGGLITSFASLSVAAGILGISVGAALGWIIGIPVAIAAVIAAVVALWKNWDKVMAGIKKITSAVCNFVVGLFDKIASKIAEIVGKIGSLGNIGANIKIGGGGGGGSWGEKTVNNTTNNNSTTTNNYFTTPKASIPPAYGKMSYVPAH